MKKIFRDWDAIFDDWQSSGMSKSDYASAKGIEKSNFRRQMRIRELNQAGKPKVSSDHRIAKESSQNFLEVVSLPSSAASSLKFLRISLPSGCVVEVPL